MKELGEKEGLVCRMDARKWRSEKGMMEGRLGRGRMLSGRKKGRIEERK